MDKQEKINSLKKLISDPASIKRQADSSAPVFITWKNQVERTLLRIYGDNSIELGQFKKLNFSYFSAIRSNRRDYSHEHRKAYERDFDIAVQSISLLIEEVEEGCGPEPQADLNQVKPKRVFISHASENRELVEVTLDLLQDMGLQPNQIFCTSIDGHGVELGSDFLSGIKTELTLDTLVLFVLTKEFYSSPVCLCEMGAAWALTKQHIPIIVPPFKYKDIKGVIPLTQGLEINEPLKLNELKKKIEKEFTIASPMDQITWERKRNNAIKRIEDIIDS